MKKILQILLWIWQAPQNIIGLLLVLWYHDTNKTVEHENDETYHVVSRFPGGISLGNTIILRWPKYINLNAWKHEYGHARQSRYLGPLYLIVIGLPSLLWAAFHGRLNYYNFYTEKWADKLGGVQR